MESIDNVTLNFSEQSIFFLNLSLGFIMFGVALKLSPKDFRRVLSQPIAPLAGVLSQFLLLPALTFVLILLVEPRPTFALGMMMVAACPGGNISNFFSSLARGNIALSISLTAVSSIFAVFMTPFNFYFWAGFYPPTEAMLREISINYWSVLETILLILGIPIILGMSFKQRYPSQAKKIQPYMHYGSILIFVGIVVLAFSANLDLFLNYIHMVIFLVFLHNALALSSGYLMGRAFKLPEADRRSLAIETGIQNSGLGLLLIFAFFQGLGGMAIVAAWWGIWHILSGFAISYWWKNREPVK